MSTKTGFLKSLFGARSAGDAEGPQKDGGQDAGLTPEAAAAVCAALHFHSGGRSAGEPSPQVVAAICGALHCCLSAARCEQTLFCPPPVPCAWSVAGRIKLMEGRFLRLDRPR